MKFRHIITILLLPILLIACSKTGTEEQSVYTEMFRHTTEFLNVNDVVGISYGEFPTECVITGRIPEKKIVFTEYSAEGVQVSQTSFHLPEDAAQIPVSYWGTDSLWLIWRDGFESSPYTFSHYAEDGTLLASVPMASLRPESVTSDYPESRCQQNLPMAETDDGIVMLWGSHLLFIDSGLSVTADVTLPTSHASVWNDNGLCVVYLKNDKPYIASVTRDGLTDERELPERFSSSTVKIIAVKDGIVYAYDAEGVIRHDSTAGKRSQAAEICTFTESYINGMLVQKVLPVFREGTGEPLLYVYHDENKNYHHSWLMKGTEMPEGDITVITVAAPQIDRGLPQHIIDFNRENKDIRVVLLDYSVYNSAENPEGGWKKLRIDLETGLLKPDIIASMSTYTREFLREMDGYFTDLYAVMEEYPHPSVRKDNIWNSVLTVYSDDGQLLALPKTFNMSTLVGLTEYLPDGEWNLETFLDYVQSLPEGIHAADAMSRGEVDGLLRYRQYDTFAAQKNFDDPLFIRYLNYKKSLPVSAESLTESQKAYDSLIGEYVDVTPDPYAIYREGTARLRSVELSGPGSVLTILEQYNVTSADALDFIGFPADHDGHHRVTSRDCVYMIPEHCTHREEAWAFIAGVIAGQDLESRQGLAILKDKAMAKLETLTVTESHDTSGRFTGYVLSEDSDDGHPELTKAVRECFTALYDSPAYPEYFLRIPMDLEILIQEEEAAFFRGSGTAEVAVKTLQSRAAIWLAEHE